MSDPNKPKKRPTTYFALTNDDGVIVSVDHRYHVIKQMYDRTGRGYHRIVLTPYTGRYLAVHMVVYFAFILIMITVAVTIMVGLIKLITIMLS